MKTLVIMFYRNLTQITGLKKKFLMIITLKLTLTISKRSLRGNLTRASPIGSNGAKTQTA